MYQSIVVAIPSCGLCSGCQSSSRFGEARIDRVTPVVAEAVGDEGDQRRGACRAGRESASRRPRFTISPSPPRL